MAKVLFGEYLESIEGTEQEKEFFSNLEALKDGLAQAPSNIPFAGKMLNALKVLCNCESVAEFRDTEEYMVLAGWYTTISDGGGFSLSPGPETKRKILKVLAIIGGVLLALLLFRRRRHK